MTKNLLEISISEIFVKDYYCVPIYQRNYAWNAEHIEQLIEDINDTVGVDGNYYLGTLIVNQNTNGYYEVIDGQQRLTTLYLLQRYLNSCASSNYLQVEPGALSFEARPKSNDALVNINQKDHEADANAMALVRGYQIIKKYFERNRLSCREFAQKLQSVFLVRIQVPKDIDLNYYFEIMNTRGEQLQPHEIVKANFLERLCDDECRVAAMIWEKCSEMDSYIQMNFEPMLRKVVFGSDWNQFLPKNFDEAVERFKLYSQSNDSGSNDSKTLRSILEAGKQIQVASKRLDDENERFESIISFPNFLLQVNAVLGELSEEKTNLDDKNLLNTLRKHWSSPKLAKEFIFGLLKSRFLFDQYIIKREFADDYRNDGRWSLRSLEKYHHERGDKPRYRETFGRCDDCSVINQQLRTLQSCLRVTYTSPKTMYWVARLLSALYYDQNDDCSVRWFMGEDLIMELENYCRQKISVANYQKASGFEIERIVFNYLDYLLYRDGYQEIVAKMPADWQFQFRNSIEHFYPQRPTGNNQPWSESKVNDLGNLALVTVSDNSKFSNNLPVSKITNYPEIVKQSFKLQIMAEITNNSRQGWTANLAIKHGDVMRQILSKDMRFLK